ncbi:hypothetical protein EVAR_94732_1 [Eumeta japonica]|uniref:Uncharacterized protein n=1 Tax=Eumeta variegata TaxID=151549 RepID=A0A4C1UX37_EUMVA|nr:hypothetical protein EVAR_94732_1 [Eumeta japonica]
MVCTRKTAPLTQIALSADVYVTSRSTHQAAHVYHHLARFERSEPSGPTYSMPKPRGKSPGYALGTVK